MKKRGISITLLISFLLVLWHMMVPHHHHESIAKINIAGTEHVSHAHHHGIHHDHHNHEKQDSDSKESNDQNIPQHFHFSTSDSFEPLRINSIRHELLEQANATLAIVNLFSWNPDESYHTLEYINIWPIKTARSQNKPGANGLRGPPSIA